MALRSLIATALLASSALARTDLDGCTSSHTVVRPSQGGTPYASIIWYVPGTGEICEFLDCGGGRAPPKTTVPGCPLYVGTATYSPRYLSTAAQATPMAAAASSSSSDASAGMTTATAGAHVTESQTQITAPPSSATAAAVSGSGSASSGSGSVSASASDSVSQTTQTTAQTIIITAPVKPTLQPSSGTGKNSSTTSIVNGAVPAGASGLGSLVVAGVAAAAMMMMM